MKCGLDIHLLALARSAEHQRVGILYSSYVVRGIVGAENSIVARLTFDDERGEGIGVA